MTLTFVYFLEMLGTAAFAISGALAASRKNMDIFGFSVLALMPAIGGGTIRDLVIGRTPVFWIEDSRYVTVAIISAIIVFFAPYKVGSRRRVLIWMDAMGLALFAALGTKISLAHGTGPVVAVMLGVTTAVTGGMIRDMICAEVPLILSNEIYATAAFVAGGAFVLAESFSMPPGPALAMAVLAGFTVRALGIIYNWSLPSFGSKH
jgi:uncharacterized membrane protein YeiH